MSDPLWPNGLQHARLPCPSPTPGAYSNSCPSRRWCHPISHPLLLPPSIFPSIRVFSNEPVLHIRWPKHWSFSFNISPFNEYSGLISFRMDWLDLLAVQGTLKSLLQHHRSSCKTDPCGWWDQVQRGKNLDWEQGELVPSCHQEVICLSRSPLGCGFLVLKGQELHLNDLMSLWTCQCSLIL